MKAKLHERSHLDTALCCGDCPRMMPCRGSLVACMMAALVGCGSDSHPDSGYGESQPVPATRTCDALCERLVDCVVQLCNENTSSTKYDVLADYLLSDCELSCSDAAVESAFTAEEWTCTFTDSCRESFEHDSCMTGANYTCD